MSITMSLDGFLSNTKCDFDALLAKAKEAKEDCTYGGCAPDDIQELIEGIEQQNRNTLFLASTIKFNLKDKKVK